MKPQKKANEMTVEELASYIDYSILKPEFTKNEIVELTKDAVKLGCATVCINPNYLELCSPFVKGSKTELCPVCDFPFGTSSTESRVNQIQIAGSFPYVKEIDIVVNFGLVKSGAFDEVERDIASCVKAAHSSCHALKVIFETDALCVEEIKKLCAICVKTQVDFVKTSTGFLTGFELKGATSEIIELMMKEVNGKCKIKGSGCIRTREHFLHLIDMGIDRMGVGYKSVHTVLGL